MQDPAGEPGDKLFYAKNLADANFPRDPEGRVYHLGVKRGEVANRVLSVGEARRAKVLSDLMDNPTTSFQLRSTREFVTHTGTFNGVPLTIIATGMGTAMIDFVVRESRAVVDGPMVFARFGTCGTPQSDIPVGTIAVASGSVAVTRNFDAFVEEPAEKDKALSYYHVSRPSPANTQLSALIAEKLKAAGCASAQGMNATADSFYCSQGRTGSHFEDNNETLVTELLEKHPDLVSLEMETHQLLHLAACSKGVISASAACIVLAQRKSNEFLSTENKTRLEVQAGRAVLEALTSFPLPEEALMSGPDCVWTKVTK